MPKKKNKEEPKTRPLSEQVIKAGEVYSFEDDDGNFLFSLKGLPGGSVSLQSQNVLKMRKW